MSLYRADGSEIAAMLRKLADRLESGEIAASVDIAPKYEDRSHTHEEYKRMVCIGHTIHIETKESHPNISAEGERVLSETS